MTMTSGKLKYVVLHSQRRGTARSLPKLIVICVLFMCKCVLYYCSTIAVKKYSKICLKRTPYIPETWTKENKFRNGVISHVK